jgi:hypothetical protein
LFHLKTENKPIEKIKARLYLKISFGARKGLTMRIGGMCVSEQDGLQCLDCQRHTPIKAGFSTERIYEDFILGQKDE